MIPCSQEGKIAEVRTIVDRLDKDINGNGKPGLRDSVTTLNEKLAIINELTDSITRVKDELNALVAVRKYNARLAAFVISILGLLVAGTMAISRIEERKTQEAKGLINPPVDVLRNSDQVIDIKKIDSTYHVE